MNLNLQFTYSFPFVSLSAENEIAFAGFNK